MVYKYIIKNKGCNMSIQDLITVKQVKIDILQKNIKDLQKKVRKECEALDQLLLELNEEKLKGPAWLFKNPTMPGAEVAIDDLVKSLYGGSYNGPTKCGYIHDENHNPVQVNFSFSLEDYGPEKEVLYKNCAHFAENLLQFLDPVVDLEVNNEIVKVVPFQFSSETWGLDYLGYCTETGVWYHYTLTYGRVKFKEIFKDFKSAFEKAFQIVNAKK